MLPRNWNAVADPDGQRNDVAALSVVSVGFDSHPKLAVRLATFMLLMFKAI